MKQILRTIESKSIMISIRSQHALNILNGKKTLELRTWIPKGYVGWVYVYVTKGKSFIYYGCHEITEKWSYILSDEYDDDTLNGKVVFRFWFDEYDKLEWDENLEISSTSLTHNQLLEQSCVDYYYLNNNFSDEDANIWGYVWHINKLEVFDKPKELSEFYKTSTWLSQEKLTSLIKNNDFRVPSFRLTKAPQRSQWVYVNE